MTFGTFSIVQWIAFLFVLLGLIKLLVIFTKGQKKWMDIVSPLYKNGKRTSWIFLAISLVILYYLLQELSIIQVIAVMAFSSFLIGFSFMQNSSDLMALAKKMTKKKFTGAMWLYIIIWLILSFWALKELFF